MTGKKNSKIYRSEAQKTYSEDFEIKSLERWVKFVEAGQAKKPCLTQREKSRIATIIVFGITPLLEKIGDEAIIKELKEELHKIVKICGYAKEDWD